jgi:tRNA uridine 5-carboxymethylaminomethyl modification enzyme
MGLVGETDWERFNLRRDRISIAKRGLAATRLKSGDAAYLAASEMLKGDLGQPVSLANLARRPGITTELIWRLLPISLKETITIADLESALADNLYEGYIKAQDVVIKRLNRNDEMRIPGNLDFKSVQGLSHEMIERLERCRPKTLGEARNIPGLTAAALSTLYVASGSRD